MNENSNGVCATLVFYAKLFFAPSLIRLALIVGMGNVTIGVWFGPMVSFCAAGTLAHLLAVCYNCYPLYCDWENGCNVMERTKMNKNVKTMERNGGQ